MNIELYYKRLFKLRTVQYQSCEGRSLVWQNVCLLLGAKKKGHRYWYLTVPTHNSTVQQCKPRSVLCGSKNMCILLSKGCVCHRVCVCVQQSKVGSVALQSPMPPMLLRCQCTLSKQCQSLPVPLAVPLISLRLPLGRAATAGQGPCPRAAGPAGLESPSPSGPLH